MRRSATQGIDAHSCCGPSIANSGAWSFGAGCTIYPWLPRLPRLRLARHPPHHPPRCPLLATVSAAGTHPCAHTIDEHHPVAAAAIADPATDDEGRSSGSTRRPDAGYTGHRPFLLMPSTADRLTCSTLASTTAAATAAAAAPKVFPWRMVVGWHILDQYLESFISSHIVGQGHRPDHTRCSTRN